MTCRNQRTVPTRFCGSRTSLITVSCGTASSDRPKILNEILCVAGQAYGRPTYKGLAFFDFLLLPRFPSHSSPKMDGIKGHSLPVLFVLGILSHLAVFIRIKPMVQGPAVALAFLIAPSIIFVTLRYLTITGLYSAATATTIWYGSYIAGVLVSMLAYRTFFHRLRHYPGSRLASLTQFHHVWNTKDRIDHYSYIDKLHKQYGDFVRIGPNLLSIADPAIVNIVYGPTTKFTKSDWYDVGSPVISLHQMRDNTLHDRRRRHGWDKARPYPCPY